VSPRAPQPEIRAALIDAAAHLLAEGPAALTTRRLAAAVGTSTMAVYTYFRGMDELRFAVRQEGFDRLAGHLNAVTLTDDPVADIAALGGAYMFNALANPHLYRVMFMEHEIDDHEEVGEATFESLVTAVERAVQAGRFRTADAYSLATQLWAMSHGIVTLHLSHLLTFQEAVECLIDMGTNLFIGFGDEPSAAERSIKSAIATLPSGSIGVSQEAG
jgi:AcrR family transcriptional regulator